MRGRGFNHRSKRLLDGTHDDVVNLDVGPRGEHVEHEFLGAQGFELAVEGLAVVGATEPGTGKFGEDPTLPRFHFFDEGQNPRCAITFPDYAARPRLAPEKNIGGLPAVPGNQNGVDTQTLWVTPP